MSISPWVKILIGFCVLVMCVAIAWTRYKPNMDEVSMLNANTARCNVEADKMQRAKVRVANAQAAIVQEDNVWKSILAVKTPGDSLEDGGIDIGENGAQLVVDSQKFANSIQSALNHQIKTGGVKVLTSNQITQPGSSPSTILADYYNYPKTSFPVVIFDLGTVEVEGTYDQIMANVRGWTNMPHYLAVADGLKLEGTSPKLRGTYSLTLVGYVRGQKLFTPLPEGAAAAGASAPGQATPGTARRAPAVIQ